ncbi:MAG: radical SAM family heme chaperone HemW [Coriobacteriales bacterium]|nr:radical SAM family heme chaperone HemW [Coriobacteriales bacterium]
MAGSMLYIHIPFCVKRCNYCDFFTSAEKRGSARIAAYMGALGIQLKRLFNHIDTSTIQSCYIGGGTPSFTGSHLTELAQFITDECKGVEEFTCEANPESFTFDLAEGLRKAGVTRISLGVQSLSEKELAYLGRAHNSSIALSAINLAKESGFRVSCDLMCGLKGQTAESWQASLQGIVDAGATHISCYPLTIEPNTPLGKLVASGLEDEPDEDFQADCMLMAQKFLKPYGFERYEVASYALTGQQCRHNLGYWSGISYYGLGAGASSMGTHEELKAFMSTVPCAIRNETEQALCPVSDYKKEYQETQAEEFLEQYNQAVRFRWRIQPDTAKFYESVQNSEPLELIVEAMSAKAAAAEDLMLGMRRVQGLSAAELEQAIKRGIDQTLLNKTIDDLEQDGYLMRTETKIIPTKKGWLEGNHVFGALWDLA